MSTCSRRARFRRRGKHKALRREAQKTWDALQKPAEQPDPSDDLSAIILPLIRKLVPQSIAGDLASVQPMNIDPEKVFGKGFITRDFMTKRYAEYKPTNKEKAYARKQNRHTKKKNKKRTEEARREE